MEGLVSRIKQKNDIYMNISEINQEIKHLCIPTFPNLVPGFTINLKRKFGYHEIKESRVLNRGTFYDNITI